jgi:hypothetical protein
LTPVVKRSEIIFAKKKDCFSEQERVYSPPDFSKQPTNYSSSNWDRFTNAQEDELDKYLCNSSYASNQRN